MDNRVVVFIDSGVGGLPYFGYFRSIAPGEPAIYIADNMHFPYGPKSKEELRAILFGLTEGIVARFDPKLIVIACNTASVTALPDLRASFPAIPFIGTVPAIKPAALFSKKKRIGVLATERTVKDPYIALLSERFSPDCALVGIAAPELVEFVEIEYPTASAEERLTVARRYVDRFRALEVDALVLGCTHFLFLADEFSRECDGEIAVFDSREGVANRALSVLSERGSSFSGDSANPLNDTLFITDSEGDVANWNRFASLFGLRFVGALESTP